MGDLVLAEDEVSPVMLALQENGLQITALHNHILHETSALARSFPRLLVRSDPPY
jgi:hypothetical protein